MKKNGFRALSHIALISLIFLLQGCENSSTDLVYNDETGISVRAAGSGILITNKTSADIYYFLIERNAAAYTDWIALCGDENKIDAGSGEEILYSRILNYQKDCDLLLYWWNCGQAENGGLKAGLLKSISFKTK